MLNARGEHLLARVGAASEILSAEASARGERENE